MKILVDEINMGSVEQARGIEQIARSISQIEQVTHSSAANTEQTASAAQQLSAQAQTLQDVVQRLSVMVDGTSNAVPASRRTPSAQPTIARVPLTAKTSTNRTKAVTTFHQTITSPHLESVTAGNGTASVRSRIPMSDDFKEF